MSDFYYSDITVYGFHGCSKEIKAALLNGNKAFKPSLNDYDWLGNGIYFWENDPFRAQDWATYRHKKEGSVIGAKIRLRRCFDLSNKHARLMLAETFNVFAENTRLAGHSLPVNRQAKNTNPADRVKRYLDKAVIQYAFEKIFPEMIPSLEFDSIRAPFQEGFELYEGSGFRQHDHIHLCIRNADCIESLFDPFDFST